MVPATHRHQKMVCIAMASRMAVVMLLAVVKLDVLRTLVDATRRDCGARKQSRA